MKNDASRFVIKDSMQITTRFEEWPNATTPGPHAYLNSFNPESGQQAISRSAPYSPTPSTSIACICMKPCFICIRSIVSQRGDDTHGIRRNDPRGGPGGLAGIQPRVKMNCALPSCFAVDREMNDTQCVTDGLSDLT